MVQYCFFYAMIQIFYTLKVILVLDDGELLSNSSSVIPIITDLF